jgi:hypothetical protein
MALVSPGVEVTIIDESNYIPAATNSVPYVLIATAQNKISGTGVGVAAGTLAANAGKVYLITSQRDLAATFGNPFFYKTSAGTPINGYELNEYGLLAAFSVLGISNRAYVQRADVDLTELTASLTRPLGAPADGTFWLDTTTTSWGIFEWNATTSAFTVKTPIVITDSTLVTGTVPLNSVGSIGDYAVVTTNSNNPVYYKNNSNTWVLVGSDAWMVSWPALQGINSVTGNALTIGNTLEINGTVITLSGQTLTSLVNQINAAAITGVTAAIDSSNRLELYGDSTADGGVSYGYGVINIDPSSSAGLLTTLGIFSGVWAVPALQQSPNYVVPLWRGSSTDPRPTGSVWNMTTAVNLGADISVKKYDSVLGAFVTQNTPIYANDASANNALDPSGGGRNIPQGSLYVQYNSDPEIVDAGLGLYNNQFTLKVFERLTTGPTRITGDDITPAFTNGDEFIIQASAPGSNTLSAAVTATLGGTTAADFVTAVSAAGVPYVSAVVNSNGAITLVHSLGGEIYVEDTVGTPVADAGFYDSGTGDPLVEGCRNGVGVQADGYIISNWVALTYIASSDAPDQDPANDRLWYYSATDQVDIMIQSGTSWSGYKNVSVDVRGYNLTQTNSTGPIISATEPTEQTDGTPLVFGDLWIDTSNLELYPVIYRWENVSGASQWVAIDNTDSTTQNGILFADARWAPNGTTDPITDPIPTITSLLTSNYLDLDAPDPGLYPTGTLLFNTRRSGFNVKSFQVNYFNTATNPNISVDAWSSATTYVINSKVLYQGLIYVALRTTVADTPTTSPSDWSLLETNAWVTAVGNRADGSPYMGRLAQRQVIVQAMKGAIDTQDTLREEQVEFNLLAAPNYPELVPNMVALNNERSNTGFIIGDTPLRLPPNATDIVAWSTDNNGLGFSTGDGLVSNDTYLGVFYPSCQTTDLTGSQVVQPPSHMMLRTIVRSDEVSYPWLAPAGVRRGVVDNAERLGYVNGQTGEFTTIATGQGLRDVLYTNKINPITFIPGVGITNYGNKTEAAIDSALDRINVARLVAFIRGRLQEIGKQFVFEPNDQITRNEITNAIDGLMIDLIAKRGIYDYLVVCDLSNNTPARIDRNELWVDIAIEPVKAVEFIYIPVRIKNTGEISGGQVASSATV